MAANKNPLSDKAYELYKGGMKLVDIADQLGKPASTIRRWKSTHNWDGERSGKGERNKGEHSSNKRSDEQSWLDIERDYVTDISKKPCSLEKLAKKHSVSVHTIQQHCQAGGWVNKRSEYKKTIARKVLEKSADKDADRIVKLLNLADKAVDKAEQSLNELESYVVRNKRREKKIELDKAVGKATKEVTEEREELAVVQGPVDRQGLLFVTNALKNLKDIQLTPMNLEIALEDTEHKQEYDEKKLELEYIKLEAGIKESEQQDDTTDNFFEALNATASEVWEDGVE